MSVTVSILVLWRYLYDS